MMPLEWLPNHGTLVGLDSALVAPLLSPPNPNQPQRQGPIKAWETNMFG